VAVSKEHYNSALADIAKRKQSAEAELELRRQAFGQTEPRFNVVDSLMRESGWEAVRIIIEKPEDAKAQIELLKTRNLALQTELASLLAKHRLPEDYLTPPYTCPACSDTGFSEGFMCECLKSLMRQKAFEALNAGTPLELSGFEQFKTSYYPEEGDFGISPRTAMAQVLKNCKSYAKGFSLSSPSMIFLGETGLGKTHLSLAIAKAVIEKSYGVVYGSVQDFMYRVEGERFGKIIGSDTTKLLMDCDLLILDDLGAEFVTQFTVSVLHQIINFRLLSRKPTIISTNLSLDEMEAKYGERIVSRISGNYKVVKFFGSDIRVIRRK
jgi:DNA replication protein DnaC